MKSLAIALILFSISMKSPASENLKLLEMTSPVTIRQLEEYENQVSLMLADPSSVDRLTPGECRAVIFHMASAYFHQLLSIPQQENLRREETSLIGLVLCVMANKVDGKIDVEKEIPASALPYEMTALPSDLNNDAKRQAYNRDIANNQVEIDAIKYQIALKSDIKISANAAKDYLAKLYMGKGSSIKEEISLLKQSGLNQDMISFLTKSP